MQKYTTPLLLVALLTLFSGQAYSQDAKTSKKAVSSKEAVSSEAAATNCDMPAGPIIPDGNVASEDELVAAQKAMKMFQTSLVEFRNCLHGLELALDPEADDLIEEKEALMVDFNSSVDAEEQIAEDFNAAVRAFKTRQE